MKDKQTDTSSHACRPSTPIETHCPVEATISLIGGKYKSLILWKLTGGTLRFSQLRKEVPCATPKMLTQQLRELETDGLIRRNGLSGWTGQGSQLFDDTASTKMIFWVCKLPVGQ